VSEENIEIVRRSTDAYNRRDLDGFLENWAPDSVVDWTNSRGLEVAVLRGHEEIRAYTQRFLETFDEVRLELNDIVEVEDDLLIVDNVALVRGRDGIETQARSAWLISFQDGLQTSLTLYQTKEEAVEAAGLREERDGR